MHFRATTKTIKTKRTPANATMTAKQMYVDIKFYQKYSRSLLNAGRVFCVRLVLNHFATHAPA